MAMQKNVNIGACGLYCEKCPRYIETVNLENNGMKAEEPCLGCHSDVLIKHCSECEIRHCIKNKGLKICAECPDYFCSKLEDFAEIGRKYSGAKHRLTGLKNLEFIKENGLEKWYDDTN